MVEVVIPEEEVHQVIQVLHDQQEQELPTLVVVAVELQEDPTLAVMVDQV
jgi:hypothetical protein